MSSPFFLRGERQTLTFEAGPSPVRKIKLGARDRGTKHLQTFEVFRPMDSIESRPCVALLDYF